MHPSPPHILHIITTLRTGGAERMLTRIIFETQKDVSHAVISLTSGGEFSEQLRHANIPVYSLDMDAPLKAVNKFLGVSGFLQGFKPQIIAGWMGHGNLAATIIKFFMPKTVKLIWHIRMTLYDLKKESLMQKLTLHLCKWLSRMPDAILYNSEAGKLQHEAFGFSTARSKLVDNGFDLGVLKPDTATRQKLRQQFNLTDNNCLIGMVGRYHPMKNHALFVRAASEIQKKHPHARFLLAGLGCDKDNSELIQLLTDHQILTSTILLGPRSDIADINNALDLALSTSSWGEGFSNTLAEAMACGTPCIATDIGGARHVIGDTGSIVTPENTAQLTDAIDAFLNLPAEARREMGDKAQQRIRDHFDIQVVARQYLDCYLGHSPCAA